MFNIDRYSELEAINTCLNGWCKTDPSLGVNPSLSEVCNCLQNCEVMYNTPSYTQNISGAFGVSAACQGASSKQHLQVPLLFVQMTKDPSEPSSKPLAESNVPAQQPGNI